MLKTKPVVLWIAVIVAILVVSAIDANKQFAQRATLNAARERANRPWALVDSTPGWYDGPTCLEFAINYADRLNHYTDARAWIVLVDLFDYVDHSFSAHY